MNEYRKIGHSGETEIIRQKSIPIPLCPPHIPHGLALDQIQLRRLNRGASIATQLVVAVTTVIPDCLFNSVNTFEILNFSVIPS